MAVCFLLAPVGRAQTTTRPVEQAPEAMLRELDSKYPGLLTELGTLFAKLQAVELPGPRNESRILPLLPESTVLYAAIPNYGAAVHQVAKIFHQEVKENAVLRNWLEKNQEWAAAEPKLEDSLELFAQLNAFLGNETVISGALNGPAPSFLIAAEVRKAGLKEFLQQKVQEPSGKAAPPRVRVFDPQGLAAVEGKTRLQDWLVLVRPDVVLASTDLPTLKNFNARLEQRNMASAAAGFKERMAREYQGGVTLLTGADLQRMLRMVPIPQKPGESPLQRSGFADLKYLVWERKEIGGESVGQGELSFVGPRQGAAAWLAKSRPLSTLDFVSPRAMLAATIVLNNPAQIFEDVRALAGPNQNAFTTLAQFEQILKVSLKDDVLANLTGEFTLELDDVQPANAVWRAIFKAKDTEHLQKTFATLLAATGIPVDHAEENGIAYHTLHLARPGQADRGGKAQPGPPPEVSYALADGCLIIGSGREAVSEALQLDRSGESLGKSRELRAALPPGHTLEASALVYQDPLATATLQMRRFAPSMAESLAKLKLRSAPSVIGVYADDTTIREASRSTGLDLGAALLGAAVAIPNLIRSRVAANEASAVGTVRTIMVAQVTYSVAYPKRIYAPNLRALGPDPSGGKPTPQHAELVDESIAGANCSPDGWCTKSGYRFNLTSDCKLNACSEYVVTATPLSSNTGTRSFCTESDGIIRTKTIGTLLLAPNAAECHKWEALK
jgi:hypothetical protein